MRSVSTTGGRGCRPDVSRSRIRSVLLAIGTRTIHALTEVAKFSATVRGHPRLDPPGQPMYRLQVQVDRPPSVLRKPEAWHQIRPANRQDHVLFRLRFHSHGACPVRPADGHLLTESRVNRERDPGSGP
jgi:hypothetical protein